MACHSPWPLRVSLVLSFDQSLKSPQRAISLASTSAGRVKVTFLALGLLFGAGFVDKLAPWVIWWSLANVAGVTRHRLQADAADDHDDVDRLPLTVQPSFFRDVTVG